MRQTLRPEERAESIRFEVVLRMRDFEEFQSRLGRGEKISPAEMESKYLPLAGDYQVVKQWIASQGLAITRTNANHLSVFGRGSVRAVEQAFQTAFARVATADGEFTSAVAEPSLPADLAPLILGVHGLQPHLRFHRAANSSLADAAATTGGTVPYYPAQIAHAYGTDGVSQTGAGQTIGVMVGAYPNDGDLTAFWAASNVNASLQNIQHVDVGTGPASTPPDGYLEEATLDTEWTSGLAPGATIRLYGFDGSPTSMDELFQQIYDDLPTHPGLHQVSISFGEKEGNLDSDYLIILAQYTAVLASSGVAIVASSGDADPQDSSSGTKPVSPASDPSVTGVGGTTLLLWPSGDVEAESDWPASVRGKSGVFRRPAYQVGAGIAAPAYAQIFDGRLIPDLSAAADPRMGAAVVFSGKTETIGGTSWSAPIWAALVALINQARADSGRPAVGFLNPQVYALIGSTAVRGIAGPRWDPATGVGVPNVAALIAALGNPSSPPAIVGNFGDPTDIRHVAVGQSTTFAVAATGASPLAYQWQRLPSRTSTWIDLANGGAFEDVATSLLVVHATDYAMNGDQFRCLVKNDAGSATGRAKFLMVNPYGITTLAGLPAVSGSADGAGSNARFSYPGGIRTDGAGNIYVTDADNDVVRKITPLGTVTTIAGSAGQAGSTDGIGTAARFHDPGGLALDQAGNIYVADSENYTVRKITPDGTVTTVAGKPGVRGSADGTGADATFYEPENVAIGPDGNLYIPDGGNHTIRRVTPAGEVTTIAGMAGVSGLVDGTGPDARFNLPTGIAVDAAGNVFVADTRNNCIREITPAGRVSTLANGLNHPAGVAVDSAGVIWVADTGNNQIRRIYDPVRGFSETYGLDSNRPGNTDGPTESFPVFDSNPRGFPAGDLAPAQFNHPSDVAVDSSGLVYVADARSNTVRRLLRGFVQSIDFPSYPSGKRSVLTGQNAILNVGTVAGSPPISYQWHDRTTGKILQDDNTFSGTSTGVLTVRADSSLDGAQFACVASNNRYLNEADFSLAVLGPPVITGPAQAIAGPLGGNLILSAPILNGVSFAWLLNGQYLASTTTPTLALNGLTASNLGTYSVTATNSYGSVVAPVGTLRAASAQLRNLSSRAVVGKDAANALVVGFVTQGTGSKQILLRGIGPGLQQFGVSGTLADPTLTLFGSAGQELSSRTGWDYGNMRTIFSQLGAFALPQNSSDAALYQSLAATSYTASITVESLPFAGGIALAEIYDGDQGSMSARLINLSARAGVGTGAKVLVAGFVVGGTGTEKVVVRGIGPALGTFNVPSPLANPQLVLYDSSGAIIARNSGWSNAPTAGNSPVSALVAPATASLFSALGAFALPAGSADCALVATLPPGAYTAIVSGTGDSTGTALVEIYETQ